VREQHPSPLAGRVPLSGPELPCQAATARTHPGGGHRYLANSLTSASRALRPALTFEAEGKWQRQAALLQGRTMSELIVIGYDDQASATQAYNQVLVLAKDFIVKLTGLAIVNVDAEGKSHVETPQKIVGVSAAGGAMWGMLIGLLFFVPGVGLLLGGAMGALFGKLGKTGVNEQFRSQVQDMLKPGAAAVVIMAEKITEDKFADAMGPFGGQVLKTSLSEEDEKELASELAEGS